MENRLPPKNHRRIELLPNKYRQILVNRFRQSRYRQHEKTANRLKITAVWQNTPPVSA